MLDRTPGDLDGASSPHPSDQPQRGTRQLPERLQRRPGRRRGQGGQLTARLERRGHRVKDHPVAVKPPRQLCHYMKHRPGQENMSPAGDGPIKIVGRRESGSSDLRLTKLTKRRGDQGATDPRGRLRREGYGTGSSSSRSLGCGRGLWVRVLARPGLGREPHPKT